MTAERSGRRAEPVVAFLKQAGCDAEALNLKDKGIFGNGHFMMLETNPAGVRGDPRVAGSEGSRVELLRKYQIHGYVVFGVFQFDLVRLLVLGILGKISGNPRSRPWCHPRAMPMRWSLSEITRGSACGSGGGGRLSFPGADTAIPFSLLYHAGDRTRIVTTFVDDPNFGGHVHRRASDRRTPVRPPRDIPREIRSANR